MFGKNKVAMLVAEFLGTAVLAMSILAVKFSSVGTLTFFVAAAAAIAVAGLSYVFASVSGAHLNPAITLGAWSAHKVKTLPALMYIVVQLLGGWAAYGLFTFFVNTSLQSSAPHTMVWHTIVAEAFGVAVFAFVWAGVAAQKLSAAIVGLGFFLGVLLASIAALGAVNPAVALSARAWVVVGDGWSGLVTYAVGPLIGGVIGYNLYDLVFAKSGWSKMMVRVARPAPTVVAQPVVEVAKKPAATKAKAKKPAARKKK